jgi:hypothetical protein
MRWTASHRPHLGSGTHARRAAGAAWPAPRRQLPPLVVAALGPGGLAVADEVLPEGEVGDVVEVVDEALAAVDPVDELDVVGESSVVTSVTAALLLVAWALWARLPPMASAPTTAVAPAARRARRPGCGRRRRWGAGVAGAT